MIGGCFYPQPGVGAENGAGFVGLLVNIGLPAKDNVLRGFFDFVEINASAKGDIRPFIHGFGVRRGWVERKRRLSTVWSRIQDPVT